VDLYRAFKLGIRNLSLLDKEKKCPLEYKAGDDTIDKYMEALNNLLSSDSKKYTSEFSGGQQTAGWLSKKVMVHKSKFETDQKNQLNKLAKKRKAEEEKKGCSKALTNFCCCFQAVGGGF
jgi:hypothetical protein